MTTGGPIASVRGERPRPNVPPFKSLLDAAHVGQEYALDGAAPSYARHCSSA